MKIPNWQSYPKTFRFFIIILVILGIVFRFVNLDRNVYWHDEMRTSLRIAGYRVSELIEGVFDGRVVTREDLHKFQRVNPDRGPISSLISLAANDPKHPPLYYAIARLWAQLFGDSVAVVRSLSAFISLLAFPCLYWLCMELFESHLTAAIAIGLFAVSPFHVLYAREAREYALWTVTILLSNAALLRAIRLQTQRSWMIYAATVVASIYSFTLSVLMIAAQGIYVAGVSLKKTHLKKFELSQPLISYFQAIFIAILTFIPWSLLIILRWDQLRGNTAHLIDQTDSLFLIKGWIFGLSSLFFDPSGSWLYELVNESDRLWMYLIRLPFLILAGYSVYFIIKKTPPKISLLPVAFIGVQVILMMLPDLIFQVRTSFSARYMIPLYIGIQLSIAYLLADRITSDRRRIGQGVMVAIVSSGVISCAIASHSDVWWNKGEPSFHYPQIANLINQSDRPLLVSNSAGMNAGNIISLSYLLDPKVRFQLVVDPKVPQITDGFSDLFLYNPSDRLVSQLQKQYKIEVVSDRANLFKINRPIDGTANP